MGFQGFCKSEDLIRAYTLILDRIVTAEIIRNCNQLYKLEQELYDMWLVYTE